MRHKIWEPGRIPDTLGGSKNALGSAGIPLKKDASGAKR